MTFIAIPPQRDCLSILHQSTSRRPESAASRIVLRETGDHGNVAQPRQAAAIAVPAIEAPRC